MNPTVRSDSSRLDRPTTVRDFGGYVESGAVLACGIGELGAGRRIRRRVPAVQRAAWSAAGYAGIVVLDLAVAFRHDRQDVVQLGLSDRDHAQPASSIRASDARKRAPRTGCFDRRLKQKMPRSQTRMAPDARCAAACSVVLLTHPQSSMITVLSNPKLAQISPHYPHVFLAHNCSQPCEQFRFSSSFDSKPTFEDLRPICKTRRVRKTKPIQHSRTMLRQADRDAGISPSLSSISAN